MYVLILVQFLPLFSPSLHRPLVFLALSAPVSGIYVRLGMRSSAPLFPSPAWSPRALNCLLRSPFAASSTPAPSAYVVVLQQQEHRPQTNATRKKSPSPFVPGPNRTGLDQRKVISLWPTAHTREYRKNV